MVGQEQELGVEDHALRQYFRSFPLARQVSEESRCTLGFVTPNLWVTRTADDVTFRGGGVLIDSKTEHSHGATDRDDEIGVDDRLVGAHPHGVGLSL